MNAGPLSRLRHARRRKHEGSDERRDAEHQQLAALHDLVGLVETQVHSASATDIVMIDGYLLFQNMSNVSRNPCSSDLNNVLYTHSFRTKADVSAWLLFVKG